MGHPAGTCSRTARSWPLQSVKHAGPHDASCCGRKSSSAEQAVQRPGISRASGCRPGRSAPMYGSGCWWSRRRASPRSSARSIWMGSSCSARGDKCGEVGNDGRRRLTQLQLDVGHPARSRRLRGAAAWPAAPVHQEQAGRAHGWDAMRAASAATQQDKMATGAAAPQHRSSC